MKSYYTSRFLRNMGLFVFQSFSHVQLFATSWISWTALHQALLPLPSPGAYSKSYVFSQWCHATISFSVIPVSCLQSFPASGSFLMSLLFASRSQSIGASDQSFQWIFKTDFLYDWLVWSPCSPRDTVQKHQFFDSAFFMVQLSHPYVITGKP